MRFSPRRCLRNSVIILILYGTFYIQWRTKLEPVVVERDSTQLDSAQVIWTEFDLTESHSSLSSSTQVESSQAPSSLLRSTTTKSSPPLLEIPRILILVYTTNGGQVKWVGEFRGECILDQTSKTQCPLDKFEVTYDKQRFTASDLVIFHANNMPSVDHLKSLSKDRPISQRWVYQTMEGPRVTPDPAPLNGLFNATWLYRSDADFSAAYATYVPLSPEEIEANKMATISDLSQGKTELAAWLVSNCASQLRISFVHELKKYIKVDVFGSCSRQFGEQRSCSKRDEKHCLKKYKFYLAFENALCKDYITEKYWDHLGADTNIVPVVMGGADPADYTRLAIPGSYINVMDFKTVKQLAEYLQYLDRNNTAYNEYFNWRLKYKISPYHYPLCNFCKSFALKPKLRKPKVYYDLRKYWVEQARCGEREQLIRKMW